MTYTQSTANNRRKSAYCIGTQTGKPFKTKYYDDQQPDYPKNFFEVVYRNP